MKNSLLGFLLFLFTLNIKNFYSQNLIGFSGGANFGKYFTTKSYYNYKKTDPKYPFKSGYFAAIHFETDKEKHNIGLNVQYGKQATEFDYTDYDKFGAYYTHYEYQYKYYQCDVDYVLKMNSKKKTNVKLFLGPSILKRIDEKTLNANGHFPQPTVQYDTTGQAVYMYITKYWGKNNFESKDLPTINYGINFGFSVSFSIIHKLNLVLENKNTLFLNDQSLKYNINVMGLLNSSFSAGLRFKITDFKDSFKRKP